MDNDYKILNVVKSISINLHDVDLVKKLVKIGIFTIEEIDLAYSDRQYVARQECIKNKIIPSTEHKFIQAYNEWVAFTKKLGCKDNE